MEIQVNLFYSAAKNNEPVDRILLTNVEDTKKVVDSIIHFKVSDTCITCTDTDLTWGQFLEYRGADSVSFEVPRKYTDALHLYIKMIRMVFIK
ncbi:hypothetical protein Acj9p235 [Acinetobacter phage Acj9]|uniref:Uncharacterized protein n=1 Tax=Acinetobacter phage Acj9 TaxID=760939 RepID=E5EQ19_9CAUD|nr:hypothetical protein Acj9p235 [Acinetobacter phage Acj9]ADG60135.1 hypothetical protein Acj9p235 [Acinetobacter phage Acj9]